MAFNVQPTAATEDDEAIELGVELLLGAMELLEREELLGAIELLDAMELLEREELLDARELELTELPHRLPVITGISAAAAPLVPWKPKVTLAFGWRAPFQPAFLAV